MFFKKVAKKYENVSTRQVLQMHPIKDDDIQPEDEHPNKTMLKRELRTIVWDFNSLLLCVQMMFSFMLTDENSSMKVCKHCGKAFIATRPNMEFCSPQCKNQYNVYKSRAKKNDTPR